MGSYRDGRKFSVRGLHYSNKHDALSSVGKLKKFDITDNRKYALARRYYSLARKEALETTDPKIKINRMGAAAVYLDYINTQVKDNKVKRTKKEGVEMDYNDRFLNFLVEMIVEDEASAARFLKHAHVKARFKRYYKDNDVPYWAVHRRVKAGKKGSKGKSQQSASQDSSDGDDDEKEKPKKSKKAAGKKSDQSTKKVKAKKALKAVSSKKKPKGKITLKRKASGKAKIAQKRSKKINESFGNIFEFNVVDSKRQKLYSRWKELTNMGPAELKKYMNSRVGQHSGLSRSEASKQGIKSGRDSGRALIKMMNKGKNKWNEADWRWAGRQVSFISRMKGNPGKTKGPDGNLTRKAMSLKVWGHDPAKGK